MYRSTAQDENVENSDLEGFGNTGMEAVDKCLIEMNLEKSCLLPAVKNFLEVNEASFAKRNERLKTTLDLKKPSAQILEKIQKDSSQSDEMKRVAENLMSHYSNALSWIETHTLYVGPTKDDYSANTNRIMFLILFENNESRQLARKVAKNEFIVGP
jgi:hypothetical protein